jgi:hypothetical protein
MIKLTREDAARLLALAVDEEAIVSGCAWLRLDKTELKASPPWESGDYDTGCVFVFRSDLADLAAAPEGAALEFLP